MDVTEQDTIIGSLVRRRKENERRIVCLSVRVRATVEKMNQTVIALDRYAEQNYEGFDGLIPDIDIAQLRRDVNDISTASETCKRIDSDLSRYA